jgi:hypothetical protein
MREQDARTLSPMRSGLAARALVTAIATAVLVPNHPAGRVPSEDAGVFLYTARTLLQGGTPYVDVWDHKPPLVYFIDALGMAFGGTAGVWAIQALVLVSAALLSLRALTLTFGRAAAVVGTIAWLVAAPRLFLTDGQQTSYVEFYVLPLQWAALVFAARPDLRLRWPTAASLGALAGLAVLLKPTLIGVWLAIALVMIWRLRGDAIARIAAMAAGGAVTLAIVALFFASRGALDDLVDQAFVYNLAYSSFAPLAERLGAIPEGLRLTSPSGLAPLAIAAALYAVARRRVTSTLLLVATVALPIELFLATSGRGYHYYFLPWLASFGVLAAFASSEVSRLLEPRRAIAVLGVAVIAMSIQPARLVARLAATGDDGVSRAAAAYLVARTTPGDTVLIWGARTEVLVLADRRAPTREVFQYAPLATRGYTMGRESVIAFMNQLTSARPLLIVDASAGSFVTPPIDGPALAAWVSPEPQYAWPTETREILAWVEANYVRDGELPGTGWPVWRRR